MADPLALRNLLLEKLKAAGFDTGRQNQDYWYAVAKALALMFDGGALTHNLLSGRDAADCHPMTAITGLIDAINSKVNVSDIKSPHGFPLDDNSAQQTTISYNSATRQVTVTALSGSTFDIWVKGVKYEIPSPHVSTAHNATEGGWFYYYDGTDFTWSQIAWDFFNHSPVTAVYYSSIKGNGVAFDERHTSLRSTVWHRWAHSNLGTMMPSGGVISGYTLDTDTDAAVTYGISQTEIDDEDLRHVLAALPDDGPYVLWRRSGLSGYWTYDTSQTFPFYAGTYARRNYDAGGGTGWTLGDITGTGSGTYVCYYVCAAPFLDSGLRFFMIPGQINHADQTDAEYESWATDVAKGDFPFLEIAPFAKVILNSSVTFGGTTKTKIVKVQYLPVGGPGGVGGEGPDGKVAASNGDGRDYLFNKTSASGGLFRSLAGAPPTQTVDYAIIPGETTDVLHGDTNWYPGATESLLGDFFFTEHADLFLSKALTLQDSWRITPTVQDVAITSASGWAPLLNAEYLNVGLQLWPLGPWSLRLRLKKSVLAADVTVRATVYRKTIDSSTTQIFQEEFIVTGTDYDLYTYLATHSYTVGDKTDGLYVFIEASTTYGTSVTVSMETDDANLDARLETPLGAVLEPDVVKSNGLLGTYFFTSNVANVLAKALTLEDSWRATPTETPVVVNSLSGWGTILTAEYSPVGVALWPKGPWTVRLRLKKDVLAADVTVRATVYRKTTTPSTTQLFQTEFVVTGTTYDLYTYTAWQDYSVGDSTDGVYVEIEASTTYGTDVTVTMEYDDTYLDSRLETPLGIVLAEDISTPTSFYHCYGVSLTKGGATNLSFYGPDGWDEIAGGNYSFADSSASMIIKVFATGTVPAGIGWQVRLLIDSSPVYNRFNVVNTDGSSSHLMELFGVWEIPYVDTSTHTYSIEMQAVGTGTVTINAASSGSTENFIITREFYRITTVAALGGGPYGDLIVTEPMFSFSDITIADVSSTKHGLCPKAPADTTKFLRGDGTWAVPSGGGGGAYALAYEVDFSSLANLAITNGANSIDGKVWWAGNVSSAATFAIQNGNGLYIQSSTTSTNDSGNILTAPFIGAAIGITSGYGLVNMLPDSLCRDMWIWVMATPVTTYTANYDRAIVAFSFNANNYGNISNLGFRVRQVHVYNGGSIKQHMQQNTGPNASDGYHDWLISSSPIADVYVFRVRGMEVENYYGFSDGGAWPSRDDLTFAGYTIVGAQATLAAGLVSTAFYPTIWFATANQNTNGIADILVEKLKVESFLPTQPT